MGMDERLSIRGVVTAVCGRSGNCAGSRDGEGDVVENALVDGNAQRERRCRR